MMDLSKNKLLAYREDIIMVKTSTADVKAYPGDLYCTFTSRYWKRAAKVIGRLITQSPRDMERFAGTVIWKPLVKGGLDL